MLLRKDTRVSAWSVVQASLRNWTAKLNNQSKADCPKKTSLHKCYMLLPVFYLAAEFAVLHSRKFLNNFAFGGNYTVYWTVSLVKLNKVCVFNYWLFQLVASGKQRIS